MAVIGTNPQALNAAFSLNVSQVDVQKIVKRLSSGSKLANPEDDAAGVAVSSKFDAAIKRFSAVSDNIQNLTSFSQTSDGFLGVVQSQMSRLGELAVRSMDGTLSDADRANLNAEFVKTRDNINTQINNASFNGTPLFDTSKTVSGAVSEDGTNVYSLTIADAKGNVSGIANIDISTAANAQDAIGKLTTAMENVAGSRAQVNTDITSLGQYSQSNDIGRTNIETANSRIKDTDYSSESTALARANILLQASTAMLAQANLSPQSALKLLG